MKSPSKSTRKFFDASHVGFPKIRGTFLGVPIIRTIVYWGLYWGPFILGNYHVVL